MSDRPGVPVSEGRRIRLGMVGGGQGAFIGAVHRIAARLDDRFELVAGALSSDPDRAASSAAELGIAAERSYGNFQDMAKAEAERTDGIEAVAIVTPNHLHAPAATTFLNAVRAKDKDGHWVRQSRSGGDAAISMPFHPWAGTLVTIDL